MVFTDQGVVYDQYERVPQDGGLGQLVRQEGDEGTDGLGHAHHGGQGQHRVRCPAQDEGAGQEQDLHRIINSRIQLKPSGILNRIFFIMMLQTSVMIFFCL